MKCSKIYVDCIKSLKLIVRTGLVCFSIFLFALVNTLPGVSNDISIGDGAGTIAASPVNDETITDGAIIDFLNNVGNLIIETTGIGGQGIITHAVNTEINWSSIYDLTETAARNIVMNTGDVITSTGSGDFTLMANQGSETGDFIGIYLTGTNITSNDGDVELNGKGGDSTNPNYGLCQENSIIKSIGNGDSAGSISITGAVSGNDNQYGVAIVGSQLETIDGDIKIIGTCDTGNQSNYGFIQNNTTIKSSGNGNIDIKGDATGNYTGDLNSGIAITAVSVLESTGTQDDAGNISITGIGGDGACLNHGIWALGDSIIQSIKGDINITGTGGNGNVDHNVGFHHEDNSIIQSTGTGENAANITINGTGGSGSGILSYGIWSIDNSLIRSVDGDIEINGIGLSSGQQSHGVIFEASSGVLSTGDGNITINGIGSGLNADGIHIDNTSINATGTGNVILNGQMSGSFAYDILWNTLTIGKTGGTYTFNDTVQGTTLNVNAGAYNMEFNDGGEITGDVIFNNTGTTTLGNESTDNLMFTGGLDTTDCSMTYLAGNIGTTNTQIDIGDVTLNNDVMLNSGNAITNLGNVTSGGNDMTLTSTNAINPVSSFLGGGTLTENISNSLALGVLNATGGNVVLNLSGALTDSNGDTNNITADSLTIVAPDGIGDGNAIEVAISQLSTDTSGNNGNQEIKCPGGFDLINLNAGTGTISVSIDTDDNEQLTFSLPTSMSTSMLTDDGSLSKDEKFQTTTADDTIIFSGASAFTLNGTAITLNNFGSLDCNSGNDEITVSDGTTIAMDLDAGDGIDTLNMTGTGNVSGTLANIENINGGSGDLTLNIRLDPGSFFGDLDGGTGSNTLTLTGTGDQNLDGVINFQQVNLNGDSTWKLNLISTMGVQIGSGTVFGGNCTVNSLVLDTGSTVSPGNSIGTINVTGNVVFNAGTDYDVEVNAAGQSDRIIATGTATLTGGDVNVTPENGTYSKQTTYTILTAALGLGGTTFAGLNGTNPMFDYSLAYSATDVLLTLEVKKNFSDAAVTENQTSVSTVLDNAFAGTETGDSSSLLWDMIQNDGDTARLQLDQLSGIEHLYISDAVNRSAHRMKSLVERRMSVTGRLGCRKKEDKGVWFRGFRVNGSSTPENYGYEGNGFMGGFDWNLNKRLSFGIFGGTSPVDLISRDRHFRNDMDATRMGAYSNWRKGKLRFSGIFGMGNLGFETSREIDILGRNANSKYDGNDKFASFEAGFELIRRKTRNSAFIVELLGGYDYGNQEIDAFTETGANSVNLMVARRDLTSQRVGGGFRFSVPWRVGRKGSFVPELYYRRMIETEDRDQLNQTERFESLRNEESFTVSTIDKEKTNDELGFTLTWKNGLGTDIFPNYEYEGSNIRRQQSGSVGATIRF
ncbi:autotransporter domain-containing protein [bacterium]|nr:autotransporter domain-containing protein [bacterium]